MRKREAEKMAKAMALACVRNGFLEDLHAGKSIRSKTGNYFDVHVVTPEQKITWKEVSRLNDAEMKRLMQEVVNKLYTVFLNLEDLEFMSALMKMGEMYTAKWDTPKELDGFVLPKRQPKKKQKKK